MPTNTFEKKIAPPAEIAMPTEQPSESFAKLQEARELLNVSNDELTDAQKQEIEIIANELAEKKFPDSFYVELQQAGINKTSLLDEFKKKAHSWRKSGDALLNETAVHLQKEFLPTKGLSTPEQQKIIAGIATNAADQFGNHPFSVEEFQKALDREIDEAGQFVSTIPHWPDAKTILHYLQEEKIINTIKSKQGGVKEYYRLAELEKRRAGQVAIQGEKLAQQAQELTNLYTRIESGEISQAEAQEKLLARARQRVVGKQLKPEELAAKLAGNNPAGLDFLQAAGLTPEEFAERLQQESKEAEELSVKNNEQDAVEGEEVTGDKEQAPLSKEEKEERDADYHRAFIQQQEKRFDAETASEEEVVKEIERELSQIDGSEQLTETQKRNWAKRAFDRTLETGSWLEEKKSEFFSNVLGYASESVYHEGARTLFSEWHKSYAERVERERAFRTKKDKTNWERAGSFVKLTGNVGKATGLFLAYRLPFMATMVGTEAMTAAKRARYENEKKKMIGEWKDADTSADDKKKKADDEKKKQETKIGLSEDLAWEEAMRLYEKAGLSDKLEGYVAPEQTEQDAQKHETSWEEDRELLNQTYRESLPALLRERIDHGNAQSRESLLSVQKLMQTTVMWRLRRIDEKLQRYEQQEKNGEITAEQKQQKIERVQRWNEKFLKDMDTMIGGVGAIDTISYGLKTAETTGKVATAAFIANTYKELAERAAECAQAVYENPAILQEGMDATRDYLHSWYGGVAGAATSEGMADAESEVIRPEIAKNIEQHTIDHGGDPESARAALKEMPEHEPIIREFTITPSTEVATEAPTEPQIQHYTVERIQMDNNTASATEGNEAKFLFGGVERTGFDAEGNVVFDVSNMTADGSFHGDTKLDVPALRAEGKLVMLVTPVEGGESIPVPVERDGSIHIANDDPLHAWFEKGPGGQAQFTGRYLEIVHVEDASEGAARPAEIIATVKGTKDLAPADVERVLQPAAAAQSAGGGKPGITFEVASDEIGVTPQGMELLNVQNIPTAHLPEGVHLASFEGGGEPRAFALVAEGKNGGTVISGWPNTEDGTAAEAVARAERWMVEFKEHGITSPADMQTVAELAKETNVDMGDVARVYHAINRPVFSGQMQEALVRVLAGGEEPRIALGSVNANFEHITQIKENAAGNLIFKYGPDVHVTVMDKAIVLTDLEKRSNYNSIPLGDMDYQRFTKALQDPRGFWSEEQVNGYVAAPSPDPEPIQVSEQHVVDWSK